MLDDDTLASGPDISFAFSVWKVISFRDNAHTQCGGHELVWHKLFYLWFHSNFQTRLLGLSHGNMSQHQEECTVMAALNCRTQKQLEVTSKLCFSFVGIL